MNIIEIAEAMVHDNLSPSCMSRLIEASPPKVLYEDAEEIIQDNPPEAHSLLVAASETLRRVIASGYNDIALNLTLAKVCLRSEIMCMPNVRECVVQTYQLMAQLVSSDAVKVDSPGQTVKTLLAQATEAYDFCLSMPYVNPLRTCLKRSLKHGWEAVIAQLPRISTTACYSASELYRRYRWARNR